MTTAKAHNKRVALLGMRCPQASHLVRAFAVPEELLGPIAREPTAAPG